MKTVPRRTTALYLSAALAVAVLSGCTKDEEPEAAPSSSAPSMSAAPGTGEHSASPGGTTASPSASPSPKPTSVDSGDPEMVAAAFVHAYVAQDWKADGPRAYLDRIEPYATKAYVKKLRDSSSDRCDVTCEAAKKGGLAVSADDIATVVPPEAPHTSTAVWVQVTYVERSSWGSGGDSEDTGMNLKLVKSGGEWLVDARTGSE
ncbi:hypothetical protein [Streptomyces sp. NPDC059786]|uniref:hypothetical protein n=1 Tax=Streptomyces sp. NPDC059786 TaxID=3346946 RepID=UPI0036490DC9